MTTRPKPPAERVPRGCDAAGDTKAVVECTLRAEGLGALWDSGWAQAVVYCESRWVPWAMSPYGHLGLWQISPHWLDGWWASLPGDWRDPEDNTRMAAHIYRAQGRGAWSCSPW